MVTRRCGLVCPGAAVNAIGYQTIQSSSNNAGNRHDLHREHAKLQRIIEANAIAFKERLRHTSPRDRENHAKSERPEDCEWVVKAGRDAPVKRESPVNEGSEQQWCSKSERG